MRKEAQIALGIGAIIGLYEFSKYAFSYDSRQKILKRDGYKCTKCGSTDHLEAAHFDHTKNDFYDNTDNGTTLCTLHHLEDHQKNAGHNGLDREGNNWAIKSLKKRLWKQNQSEDPGHFFKGLGRRQHGTVYQSK